MRFAREIERSARLIARLARPSGRFVYRYDSIARTQLPGYNILRHCGTIWAANQAVTAGMAPPEISAALRPAVEWLTTFQARRSQSGAMFIHEQGEIKLGANGLAVLALSTLPDNGGIERADTIRRLCAYIEEQASGPDDFHHKRKQDTMEILPFWSDYYTGEALFGLVAAARLLRDEPILDEAERRIHGLAARNYGIAGQSHWMMYAVFALNEVRPAAALIDYTRRLARAIIENPDYRLRLACTPVACRTEALLAATKLLRACSSVDRYLLSEVRSAIDENLTLQLACMERDGGFRQDPHTPIVRIDYVQHNLACLVSFDQTFG